MKAQFTRLFALALAMITLVATPARADSVWLRADPGVLAMFTKKFVPVYEHEAVFAHMEGEGRFRLYVNKEGTVTRIGVVKSTGHEKLDLLAAGTLVQWKAKPGRKFATDIMVVFKLGFLHK